MINTITIRPEDNEIVRKILKFHLPAGAKVWVYGSRAKGKVRRASDLDLAIDCGKPMSWEQKYTLKDAFTESLLPYTVDLTDLQSVSPEFKAIIDDHKQLYMTIE